MTTSAQLVERHAGVVDLAIHVRPGVQSYILGAAVSLDAAYSGTTALVTVPNGRDYRSRTLRRNRVNWVEETRRGMTRISYDPVDFASGTVPGDTDVSFVRIAEVDSGGTTLPEGPILVVPPPGFFTSGRRNLVLNGTAPDVAGLANNLPPQDAMWVDLPKFFDQGTIWNDGAVDLLVSFGLGTQEIAIASGESLQLWEAGATLVSFRGDGATAAFRATFALVNGIQG